MTVLAPNSATSAALRPGGRCSRLPHLVGEAKAGLVAGRWQLVAGSSIPEVTA